MEGMEGPVPGLNPPRKVRGGSLAGKATRQETPGTEIMPSTCLELFQEGCFGLPEPFRVLGPGLQSPVHLEHGSASQHSEEQHLRD